MLSPDNVRYGQLKLLFFMSVKIDGQEEPVDIECAYVSFCYEIKCSSAPLVPQKGWSGEQRLDSNGRLMFQIDCSFVLDFRG